MKVGLLYHISDGMPKVRRGEPKDKWYELEHWDSVLIYKKIIEKMGHQVVPIEGNTKAAEKLKRNKIEFCFNVCEGYRGESREAQVPAMLEMLGIPYEGSGIMTLAITLDKAMTKRLLAYYDLLTPPFQELTDDKYTLDKKILGHFPLFVKPNSEGTGMGIDNNSIVNSELELRKRVKYLFKAYGGTVLVEKYIEGVDVTVGLVGNMPKLHVFPISMIDSKLYEKTGINVYGSDLKVDLGDKYEYQCPANLAKRTTAKLIEMAIETMRVTGTVDYSRVDFRLDRNDGNKPYILEINSLPGITPVSDLTLMAKADGWTHEKLVSEVFKAGLERNRRMGKL